MKKNIITVLLCLVISQSYAQYKISFNLGANLPYTQNLNHYLVQNGLNPLEGLGFVSGINLALESSDITTIHIETNYVMQGVRRNTNNKSTSLQGFYYSTNIGFKLINKYKYSLGPLIGLTSSEGFKLNIRNGTPTQNSLNGQLALPNSTITQLTYRPRFFFHAGLHYKFKIKNYSLGLRAGHYVRISRGKWFTASPNIPITDAPTMNPLGTYLNFNVYF